MLAVSLISAGCGSATGDQASSTTSTAPTTTTSAVAATTTEPPTTTTAVPVEATYEIGITLMTPRPNRVTFVPLTESLTVRVVNNDDIDYDLAPEWSDEIIVLPASGTVLLDFATIEEGAHSIQIRDGFRFTSFMVDNRGSTDPAAAMEAACDALSGFVENVEAFYAAVDRGILDMVAVTPQTEDGMLTYEQHSEVFEIWSLGARIDARIVWVELSDAWDAIAPWRGLVDEDLPYEFLRDAGADVVQAAWYPALAPSIEALRARVMVFSTDEENSLVERYRDAVCEESTGI